MEEFRPEVPPEKLASKDQAAEPMAKKTPKKEAKDAREVQSGNGMVNMEQIGERLEVSSASIMGLPDVNHVSTLDL